MGLQDLQGGTGLFRRGAAAAEEAERQTQAPSQRHQTGVRPNQYKGNCALCGNEVAASAGKLGDKVNGKWTVEHLDGECTEGEEAPEVEVKVRTLDDYTEPVRPGIYTVPTETGHYTFRLDLQPEDAEFAPGALIVGYLIGRDNDSDYQSFAFIQRAKLSVWKRFRTDGHSELIEAAEKLLTGEGVLESTFCLRCGDRLSHPDSIARGIGPECAKVGW